MERSEAIRILRANGDAARRMGATAMYLFGSVARGEAAEGSDLDVFIDYDETRRFSLLDLVGIKQLLEQAARVEIDLTTRDSLHPRLRDEIERSAIRVF
jgi:predicted nucleotidyltransferase